MTGKNKTFFDNMQVIVQFFLQKSMYGSVRSVNCQVGVNPQNTCKTFDVYKMTGFVWSVSKMYYLCTQLITTKILENMNSTVLRTLAVAVMTLAMLATGAQSKVQCTVGGKTYKVEGAISHDSWNKGQSSRVTFTGIPASIDEFRQLQQTLGTEPQGAVALQVMAFEMYRRDRAMGEQALQLNNTSTNYNSTVGRLHEMMGKDQSYARPYLAAALMDGARPGNAYMPSYPYCVKVRVNPVSRYQDSQMLGGTVIYLQIDSEGWDTNWRGVEVVRPEGEQYYVVSNCPALYTQCKQIKGTWQGLK